MCNLNSLTLFESKLFQFVSITNRNETLIIQKGLITKKFDLK